MFDYTLEGGGYETAFVVQPQTTTGYTVQLLYCANDRYLQPLCVSLASLAHHHPDIALEITITFQGDRPTAVDAVVQTLKAYPLVRWKIIPPHPLPKGMSDKLYYSLEMYQRYFAADILPDTDKIIYLDCDTVINGSLRPLWQTDLGTKGLAACAIPGATRTATLTGQKNKPYFNSGVMLINAKKWREMDAAALLLRTTKAHFQYLYEPDQDILNLCFMDDWITLTPIWNVIRPYYIENPDFSTSTADMRNICKNARIIHYNSQYKPWQYGDNHPRKDLYLQFKKQTPFRHEPLMGKTLTAVIQNTLAALLPAGLKEIMKKLLGQGPEQIKDHAAVQKSPIPLRPIYKDREIDINQSP